MSATAPAGSVKRKNGAEAAVAIRESENGEAPRSCINHVAVMSWDETNVPDNTLASHKRQNTGFRSANQVEVDFISSRAIRKETVALADRTKNCDLHGKVMVEEAREVHWIVMSEDPGGDNRAYREMDGTTTILQTAFA